MTVKTVKIFKKSQKIFSEHIKKRLLQEDPSRIAQDLLVHLPVVKNNSLVSHYMPLITKLLMHSINTDELLEQSRSILGNNPFFSLNQPTNVFSLRIITSDI